VNKEIGVVKGGETMEEWEEEGGEEEEDVEEEWEEEEW